MPQGRHQQTSLSSGEFDPLLDQREDVSFYYSSVSVLENVVPLKQGGGKRRDGWGFRALQRGPITAVDFSGATITAANGGDVASLTDGSASTVFESGDTATITAITNANPAVVTAAGHGFTTGDSVQIADVVGMGVPSGSTATITDASQADPCVITAASHGLTTGDTVRITGVTGMTELNNAEYTVTIIDPDSFSLDDTDSSGFTAYVSGGSAEKILAASVNDFAGTITVISADAFELDGFDTSAADAYTSGGVATKGAGQVAEYEVWRADMAASITPALWDADGLRVTRLPAELDGVTLALQRSDDAAAWTTAASLSVGNISYNRRFGAAPDSDLGSARYWRLIIDNAAADDLGAATVELSQIRAHTEAGYSSGGAVGEFSMHRLTSSIDDEYILVATAGNCDVFRKADGAWVAAVSIPHDSNQVAQIKNAPNLDTLIFYHQEQPQWLIQRLGSDENWRGAAVSFDSVTDFAFDDGNVGGGRNEVQFVRFSGMSNGDKFLVEFNATTSSEVIWTGSATDNAANLKAAIESLPDISSVAVTVDSGDNLNIEFTGADGEKPWPILIIDILTGTGTATISRKQYGKRPFDALWSATRGYPSCGAFYQGRHYMGGFAARPDLVVGSRAGSLFDFAEDADPVARSPLVLAPNTDDQVTVQNIYPGRHLQIFTSSAEVYVPSEPISFENVALKVTSRHGATSGVQPVDVQGGTLFVDRNGTALREYLFTDTEQSYTAEPVSRLAPHLVSSPRSMVLRRGRKSDEPTLLFMANTGNDDEGNPVPAAMVAIDRAQQITGFGRIKTNGTPLEFATTQAGDGFCMVRRELAGSPWNYLEQMDAELLNDCSVKVATVGSVVDLSAYPWLEGEEVTAFADGVYAGEHTVTGGQIDVAPMVIETSAEVGLRQVPRIVLHSYKGRGDASPTMRKMRIHTVLLQLQNTTAIAVGYGRKGPRPVALTKYDEDNLDPTAAELLFSGSKRVKGMGEWQTEPKLEITQLEPGPFLLKSLTYDVRF